MEKEDGSVFPNDRDDSIYIEWESAVGWREIKGYFVVALKRGIVVETVGGREEVGHVKIAGQENAHLACLADQSLMSFWIKYKFDLKQIEFNKPSL